MTSRLPLLPDKLELYRLCVQHPEAEVALLWRMYAHYRRGAMATRLREDFAGTAAVASAWVGQHDDMRAVAVESHGPTLRWAQRRARVELGRRVGDLLFVQGDVQDVAPPRCPRVDVVAALNFSSFIYHSRAALCAYFCAARRALRPGGMLVVDAFGGPGAMAIGVQKRPVPLPVDQRRRLGATSLEYQWEQRSYDAITARVDCRIHLRLRGRAAGRPGRAGRAGRMVRNAFKYDWRLWTLPQITDAMLDAGFARAQVWCDGYDRRRARSDGVYRPMQSMAARRDWVAAVVALR